MGASVSIIIYLVSSFIRMFFAFSSDTARLEFQLEQTYGRL